MGGLSRSGPPLCTIRSKRATSASLLRRGVAAHAPGKRPPPQPFVSPFWASASHKRLANLVRVAAPSLPPGVLCFAVAVVAVAVAVVSVCEDAVFRVKPDATALCSRRGVAEASPDPTWSRVHTHLQHGQAGYTIYIHSKPKCCIVCDK